MGKKSSVLIFCFIITTFSAISVSAQQTCDDTSGSFKLNSPYDKNRRLINSTLASNVTGHNGCFNGSMGLAPNNTVYAMGMCSPDARQDACSSCIKAGSDGLLQICPNQTDSFTWIGQEIICFVRYSIKSFSGALVLTPVNVFHNMVDVEKKDQKQFDSVWDSLMSRMITTASSSVRNNYSSSSSLRSSSSLYYAKDVAPVPVYGNISVLMQCTPDLSSKDCKRCLEGSVKYYKTVYHWKKGSIILRPSCFFRWELFPFYGAFDNIDNLSSQPPSLPPSEAPPLADLTSKSKTKRKDSRFSGGIIAAIVIVVIFVFIILMCVGVAIFKKRKQKQELELPTESVQFDLKTIEDATSKFSEQNKLGEGGFGEVYKGMLMNGTEVAVKRLSKTSGQGEVELNMQTLRREFSWTGQCGATLSQESLEEFYIFIKIHGSKSYTVTSKQVTFF